MKHTFRVGLALSGALTLALSAGMSGVTAAPSTTTAASNAPAAAAAPSSWQDRWATVNVLSFSDFHGHLEDEDGPLPATVDPSQRSGSGAANLATHLKRNKGNASAIVTAGDNIGGSTFLSGMFHDEPTIEVLDAMGVTASAVGNHEFDEGTNELLRIQHGGSHWKDGSYFPGKPYPGAKFQYLAGNVYNAKNGRRILPATHVKTINGVKVGFIGVVTPETTSLVSPGGITSIEFRELAASINSSASWLSSAKGVETIVAIVHEGGNQTGSINQCSDLSGPIVELNRRINSRVDGIITGHTHSAFNCTLKDWKGGERPVVASGDWGRAFNKMTFTVNRKTGDVVKKNSRSRNILNTPTTPDPQVAEIVQKWSDKAGPERAKVVGTISEDITGDASGNRGIETPMANLVADSILWGTKDANDGGAQISFMNVGGVRASFLVDQSTNGEGPGEISYEEAYKVAPFGNLLVSIDMTGADIKEALEQQYDPTRGRQYLALGVSEGFTYDWDDSQPQGSKVSNMALDGVALEDGETYRVSTLNFLQQGGDNFTAFAKGTNLLGGPEDLQNLVSYLGNHPGLSAPGDRVSGL